MRAEEVHREKLKQLGYKDEAIEELVNKYIANCTYEFAEAYHTELLNIDSVSLSVPCGCVDSCRLKKYGFTTWDKNHNAHCEKGNAS